VDSFDPRHGQIPFRIVARLIIKCGFGIQLLASNCPGTWRTPNTTVGVALRGHPFHHSELRAATEGRPYHTFKPQHAQKSTEALKEIRCRLRATILDHLASSSV
jgi:hypothetical protein